MCGRYSVIKDLKEVKEQYEVEIASAEQYAQTYNAAPSQSLPLITNKQPRQLQFYRWGLIPSWAEDRNVGYKMINARSETLLEKASFKKLVGRQRCLVISDGFYEWKKLERGKQPYRITLEKEPLFAFAGLWEQWLDKESGELVPSFTIITTEANELVRDVHDRMPVILDKAGEKQWLMDELPEKDYMNLLKPYPAEGMTLYPVSSLVNSPSNNSPEVLGRLNSA